MRAAAATHACVMRNRFIVDSQRMRPRLVCLAVSKNVPDKISDQKIRFESPEEIGAGSESHAFDANVGKIQQDSERSSVLELEIVGGGTERYDSDSPPPLPSTKSIYAPQLRRRCRRRRRSANCGGRRGGRKEAAGARCGHAHRAERRARRPARCAKPRRNARASANASGSPMKTVRVSSPRSTNVKMDDDAERTKPQKPTSCVHCGWRFPRMARGRRRVSRADA